MTTTLHEIQRRTKTWLTYLFYKGIYAHAVLKTKPIICNTTGLFEIHTVSCERDFVNTLWALKTFYHFSKIRPGLVIYDDGSLSEAAINTFSEHFVNCQIIRRYSFRQDMEHYLEAYRMSLEVSKIESFYCALKLFGPMFYAKSQYVLCMDSDILFFQNPREMLGYIKSGTPFYMSDYQNSYSHPLELLNTLLKIECAQHINAGLIYFANRDYADNMDLVETYFRKVSTLGHIRHSVLNRHEQTLAAILLTKAKAVRLSDEYQISKTLITDKTVSHHFVSDGSRIKFYTVGLSRLRSAGFIKDNSGK